MSNIKNKELLGIVEFVLIKNGLSEEEMEEWMEDADDEKCYELLELNAL